MPLKMDRDERVSTARYFCVRSNSSCRTDSASGSAASRAAESRNAMSGEQSLPRFLLLVCFVINRARTLDLIPVMFSMLQAVRRLQLDWMQMGSNIPEV